MTALAWTVGSLTVWFLCGWLGGRYWGQRAYASAQDRWRTLGHKTWRENAMFAFGTSLIAGPLSLVALLFVFLVDRGVGNVPAVASHEQKARIARLESELDDAHRKLGLPPLRRD